MIETVIFIAQFAAQLVLAMIAAVIAGILIQITVIALLILGAITLAGMAIKIAVIDYIVPFFRAAISMIATHPLIVSLVMVSIFSIAFAVDEDFRSFIMEQNYPLIFAICSVITLAVNILTSRENYH